MLYISCGDLNIKSSLRFKIYGIELRIIGTHYTALITSHAHYCVKKLSKLFPNCDLSQILKFSLFNL